MPETACARTARRASRFILLNWFFSFADFACCTCDSVSMCIPKIYRINTTVFVHQTNGVARARGGGDETIQACLVGGAVKRLSPCSHPTREVLAVKTSKHTPKSGCICIYTQVFKHFMSATRLKYNVGMLFCGNNDHEHRRTG